MVDCIRIAHENTTHVFGVVRGILLEMFTFHIWSQLFDKIKKFETSLGLAHIMCQRRVIPDAGKCMKTYEFKESYKKS